MLVTTKSIFRLFYGLSQAFDPMNHDKTNFILQCRGEQWLESWREWFFYFRCANCTIYSTWGTIKHGVLQVSILGPLLFFIYEFISDLHPTVNLLSKPISFADGTSIMFHPKSDLFQNCIIDTFLPI
jgi:hypothetical protein